MDFRPDISGAQGDDHLVTLWLANRPDSTKRVYGTGSRAFLASLGTKTLRDATVADVIAWTESLVGADTTRARLIATVKSLLSFAHRIGYTAFNVGKVLRCPKIADRLHEKIADEDTVRAVVEAAETPRDKALVRLLYASGCRIAEACKLRFADIGRGRVTFIGKGSKARTVVVPDAIVDAIRALQEPSDGRETYVFRSYRNNKPLLERDAREVVYKAAKRAGTQLSPHYFRHAHASHALDRGAPIHLVQRTLGHQNVSTTSRYLHVKPNQGSSQYLAF